jgi:hypothetical protein
MEDEDLWESVVQGVAAGGGADSEERTRLMETSRQRFLEAARAFSQANREAGSTSSSTVDPADLLRSATANAASYQPHWANPTQLVSTSSSSSSSPRSSNSRGAGNGIEVGEGLERHNLAHLPIDAAGEGRAIRAAEPLPRGIDALGSFRMPSNNSATNQVEGAPRRRAFGFRVAFDHPTAGDVTGADMGGCYLVGVTSSSFSAYNEQNGLQQSPYFWGIEDTGQKYEGSRHGRGGSSSNSRGTGRGGTYAVDVSAEAPMNEHSVLFGAREVITCVCDMDNRTLTFWRDETLLGTLITNLPRSGNLYPVAVPFNGGVTVAITGLDNCPLPL